MITIANPEKYRAGLYERLSNEKIANPEKYRAGLYERLSNENIEVASGEIVVSKEDELESGSISTQKIFNEDFCKQRNIYIYDHYTDDGVSGATFDRPDFNRMIHDIENKKISSLTTYTRIICIIPSRENLCNTWG